MEPEHKSRKDRKRKSHKNPKRKKSRKDPKRKKSRKTPSKRGKKDKPTPPPPPGVILPPCTSCGHCGCCSTNALRFLKTLDGKHPRFRGWNFRQFLPKKARRIDYEKIGDEKMKKFSVKFIQNMLRDKRRRYGRMFEEDLQTPAIAWASRCRKCWNPPCSTILETILHALGPENSLNYAVGSWYTVRTVILDLKKNEDLRDKLDQLVRKKSKRRRKRS